MFCAPSRRVESRMTFDTDSSAVNGGQMTMSTSLLLANSSLRLPTNASASAAVLFIFQLPAIINLRSLFIFKFAVGDEVTSLKLFLLEPPHAGSYFSDNAATPGNTAPSKNSKL